MNSKLSLLLLFSLSTFFSSATDIKELKNNAANGDSKSQVELGLEYLLGGIEKDQFAAKILAVRWFRKSALQDNAEAEYLLGECYEGGIGVEVNHVEALRLYQKSASKGNCAGQFSLGKYYEKGRLISKNISEANRLFESSASKGYTPAQLYIGRLYSSGKNDFKVDYSKSETYFRMAAMQGNAEAQYELGLLYLNGNGVKKNLVEAKAWIGLSFANDYQPAEKELMFLLHNLNKNESERALRRTFEIKKAIEIFSKESQNRNSQ